MSWFDRNAVPEIGLYNDIKAAHASGTKRISYAVPMDKFAFIDVLQLSMVRLTAAGTAGNAQIYGNYTPHEGSTKGWLNLVLDNGNNVGDRADLTIHNVLLHPGDEIKFLTIDSSITGTVWYVISYKITVFDAVTLAGIEVVPDIEPAKPDLQAPADEVKVIEERPWWKQILGWP